MDTEFSLVNARTNQKTNFKLPNEQLRRLRHSGHFTPCFTDFNLYADFTCSYAAYSLEVNFHILE